MSDAPAIEYQSRLALRRASLEHLTRIDARLAVGRLVVFGIGLLLGYLAWRGAAPIAWVVLPIGAFVALVVAHDRVLRAIAGASAAIAFYEHGLARIEDSWTGLGSPGERFLDERHPYANDLDLFGKGSLFQLLSLARSDGGETTLAAWLKQPDEPTNIASRQASVRELTPALDLREDVSVAGAGVNRQVDATSLVRWAEAQPAFGPRTRVAAAILTAATLATTAVAIATGSITPLLVVLGVQSGFALPLERRVRTILHGADGPARSLTALARMIRRLETESFTTPTLSALRRRLHSHDVPASTAVRQLSRLVEMHDWQHNVLFAPVALFLMWGTHLATAVEAWRRRHGTAATAWLGAVGEFEALSSVSAYAYEHPSDPYPTVEAGSAPGDARFDARELGHPLLPAARMVRNDVALTQETRVLLVSGSNMSGKSTLLRTVGINAVLAQLGAPVRAASLTMSPLCIGATLRIQDSLQEGKSRFYAEITRVRELADRARGPVPLLFLLDELFHGTNSHDRLAGATGVLRSLVERGAIGLVTTHDLALTAMARDLGAAAANVHFDDWFEGGEMRFDYRMKSGPVTRSNALALMRAVGLDIG